MGIAAASSDLCLFSELDRYTIMSVKNELCRLLDRRTQSSTVQRTPLDSTRTPYVVLERHSVDTE